MPRSAAVWLSMEAFRGPVEAISFRFGNCCRISLVSGVRSRMTHTTSNGRNRSTTAEGSATWSLNTVISAWRRTPDQSQRDVLVVVEDRNLHRNPPSAFGGKELDQSSCYRFGIVFHRNVACRLDPDEP